MPKHSGQQQQDELEWHMTGTSAEVADILTEFAQELRRGDVNVWKGQRSLHLTSASRFDLRVEAILDQDGGQALHIQLHWRESLPPPQG